MHVVSVPGVHLLSTLPQVMAVEAEVQADCELAFARLLSWSSEYGQGPHPVSTIERVVRWSGDAGAFAAALAAAGWADPIVGRSLTLRHWRDVLGYVDPIPADETPEERRKRQKRDSMRRARAAKVHSSSDTGGVDTRGQPVDTLWTRVDIGGHLVDIRGQPVDIPWTSVDKCGHVVDTCGHRGQAPHAHPYSLDLQKKKEEPEAEEEIRNVVSIAQRDVSSPPLAGPSGAAPRPVSVATAPTLFALTPPSASTAPTADGRERPAVGSGSTNGAEVRSVPVEGSDRAPEGDSGRRTKKARGGRKASVDPAVVEAPVRQVWEAYAEAVKTRVVLSKERADLIVARLADGWTADELVEAIKGYGTSGFHFGQNQQGTRYTSIELWLRDAAHVEQGLGYRRTPAQPTPDPAASKYPPRGGIEEKYARYFAEQRAAGLAEEDL